MATTTLLRIKSTNTKSISHILKDRTEYIENDLKTNYKELVSSFNCVPESAYLDFTASKILYNEFKGSQTKKRDDVLAYHIRQAFSPEDNITPEEAHEIGKKLVDEFTKGKHEYVIATHIDKKHIHNHIIFNSTTVDCTHKFNNFYNSSSAVMKISDRLCRDNNLSVVESKNEKGKHYKEWQEDKKGESWKAKLKRNIDKCIESSGDFDEFKKAMQELGYEIKEGKHIAFRAKGQERFTRAKTLGDDYTQENIAARIEKCTGVTSNKRKHIDFKAVKRLPFTVDKQLLYAARKRQISDVKSLANALMMIRNENINSRKDFSTRIDDLKAQAFGIKDNIKKLNSEVEKYREVAKYLATVNKHKDVHMKYEKCSLFSKKDFYSRHEGDILSYEHALKKLEQLNIGMDISLADIISLTKECDVKINTLVRNYIAIEKQIEAIRKAKEAVYKIINKGFEEKMERENLREKNL